MKIRESIALAAHVAANASKASPILAHLKIADGRVVATDISQQIDAPIDLPPAIAKAAFCVHGARLMRVLKALPEELELELTLRDDLLVVQAGGTFYELKTLPAADYPELERVDETYLEIEVACAELVAALRFVAPAAAIADVRYYLNGVHFLVESSRMIVTATDGTRLHRARVGIPPRSGEPVRGTVANASIARLVEIAGRHEKIMLALSPTRCRAEADEVLITKLIDGAFPDTDKVIPKNRPATAGVDRAALLAAVKRVAAIGPKALTMSFTVDAIEIDAKNAELEASGEAHAWNASGAQFETVVQGFQVDYLLAALNAYTCTRINLHIGASAQDSLFITDDNDGSRQVVLMPFRV